MWTGAKTESQVHENKIYAGNARSTDSPFLCQTYCKVDQNCQSVTFNGPNSENPNICVLNYGETARKLDLLQFQADTATDISSAPRSC